MAEYSYKEGKKRVSEILNSPLEIIKQDKLPSIEELTFTNGYYSWVTAIFVDIRNSTKLFTRSNKSQVSKVIRCFTSEIIEILRKGGHLREIGIRGDCVYGIYTTPTTDDVYECLDKTIYINTYLKMLDILLKKANCPSILAGIGISTAKELVVKAGRSGVGINNPVWIGNAVTQASNLSSIGNKNGNNPIIISNLTYNNTIKKLRTQNSDKNVDEWFHHFSNNSNSYYSANIVKSEFNDWIANGMTN